MQIISQDSYGATVFPFTADPKDALIINALLGEGFNFVGVLDNKNYIWQIHGFLLSKRDADHMAQDLRFYIGASDSVICITGGDVYLGGAITKAKGE